MRNTATQEYIAEVSELWSLDDLAKVMTPEMDVVFQVDDALHAVPLAHLPVAAYPLYQRVRSVRNSLSVLVTILQQEAERDFHVLDTDNAYMLVVSWLKKEAEEDANRKSVTWLHHGHMALAEHYGLEYYAAADNPEGNPEGSLGAISAALDQHSAFRIMTVCGHGDRRSVGVKLKDDTGEEGQERLWDGGGLNLSLVEWLLMVSCSIGRLAENGDRDVEGFCVKLALHRALSVLACRWDVDTLEACSFANEIVSQYLRLRKEIKGQRDGTTECLRAKALNEARKSFLGDGSSATAQPYVGLNTVAAFELYGIG